MGFNFRSTVAFANMLHGFTTTAIPADIINFIKDQMIIAISLFNRPLFNRINPNLFKVGNSLLTVTNGNAFIKTYCAASLN
jgi:hypothetical protein